MLGLGDFFVCLNESTEDNYSKQQYFLCLHILNH